MKERYGWESVRCFARTLQLCLVPRLSIATIDKLIAVAHKLVGHFKHSVVATEELRKRELQMDLQQKLVQDCPTRWNSIFYMLERLVELRWLVSAVLSDERITKRSDRYLDLKSEQRILAEELMKALHSIEVASTFLSCEENTSISCVLPVVCGLVKHLEQPSTDCLPVIANFMQVTATEIKKRWSIDSLNPACSAVLAAALDPHFRHLSFLDVLVAEDVKDEVIKQMESNLSEEVARGNYPTTGTEPAAKKSKTALDFLLGEDESTSSTSATYNFSTAQELDVFLSEKPVPRTINLLTWWKENSFRFPVLAKIAHSLLNIPATSTPAERILSNARLTVTKQHSSLKPKTVDTKIFFNKNMHFLK